MCSPEIAALRIRLAPNQSSPGVCTASAGQAPGRRAGGSAGSGRVARAGAGLVVVFMSLVSMLAPVAAGQQAEPREPLRCVIADGTERMPAFRYGLTAEQIDLIVDHLGAVERYEPAY